MPTVTETGESAKFESSGSSEDGGDGVQSVNDHVDVKTNVETESVIDADGPMQPKLDKYASRKFSSEPFESDFQDDWYKILRSKPDGLLSPMPTVQRNNVHLQQLEKGETFEEAFCDGSS